MSADIAAVNIDKLREEIKALRNEIARLNGQTNWVCKCGGTDTEGQHENAALRKDKARLDWLDEKGCWLTVPGQRNFISGASRAVIDAAMQEAQP